MNINEVVNINELLVNRLYKSLGEYDVVNAVLSNHVTTHEVTLQAIDAELHGDYTLATKLYNQVDNLLLLFIIVDFTTCMCPLQHYSYSNFQCAVAHRSNIILL